MSDSPATQTQVLFLFAHQDDEVGVAPRIVRELAAGNVVHCAYLTNGEAKGVSSQTRCDESARVLRSVGKGMIDTCFIGSSLGIGDGRLADHLPTALSAVAKWIERWSAPLGKIYVLAWEGGHHDHDAAHAIGLALARRYPGTAVWQFPLYNGHGTRGRFFRVMHSLPTWEKADVLHLSLSEGLRYASLCARYPSQWRTWIGLFPGVFMTLVLQRAHRVFPGNDDAVLRPPHDGPLLYERMFGVDRAKILALVRDITPGI